MWYCKFIQRTAVMSGEGGSNVTTEGRLEVLSVLLQFQLSTDMDVSWRRIWGRMPNIRR